MDIPRFTVANVDGQSLRRKILPGIVKMLLDGALDRVGQCSKGRLVGGQGGRGAWGDHCSLFGCFLVLELFGAPGEVKRWSCWFFG